MLKRVSPRLLLSITLILVLTGILLARLYALLFQSSRWVLADYYNYFLPWGQLAREGVLNYRYPLATVLWVFVPLSVVPQWFSLIWFVAPFAFAVCILGRKGVIAWFLFPSLLQAATGQLDGWLLLPLHWLFTGTAVLSEISCALVTLKPQLAFLVVPYAIWHWGAGRRWRSLLLFLAALIILHLPAFILDPAWPIKMIPELQARGTESFLAVRGASLWWWPWHGAWIIPSLFFFAMASVLFLRAFHSEGARKRAVFLLGLLLMPVLYPVSYVTVIAALKGSARQLVLMVLVSWMAVIIDILFQGWGGAYSIIPVAALWLLGTRQTTGHQAASKLGQHLSYAGGEESATG